MSPQEPERSEYRQGNTLGEDRKRGVCSRCVKTLGAGKAAAPMGMGVKVTMLQVVAEVARKIFVRQIIWRDTALN